MEYFLIIRDRKRCSVLAKNSEKTDIFRFFFLHSFFKWESNFHFLKTGCSSKRSFAYMYMYVCAPSFSCYPFQVLLAMYKQSSNNTKCIYLNLCIYLNSFFSLHSHEKNYITVILRERALYPNIAIYKINFGCATIEAI